MTQHDSGDLVKLHNGKFRRTSNNTKYEKVFAFDLDETLGCFFDLIALWNIMIESDSKKKTQQNFNSLLDIYPEFLRYGILTILEYLYHKKNRDYVLKYIYILIIDIHLKYLYILLNILTINWVFIPRWIIWKKPIYSTILYVHLK